jgi:hypothetical protein
MVFDEGDVNHDSTGGHVHALEISTLVRARGIDALFVAWTVKRLREGRGRTKEREGKGNA